MGNNLTPYSIALIDENIYFLTPHFKFIITDRVDDNELLSRKENAADPYYYHLSSCGKESFKNMQLYKFHSN